MKFTKQPEFCSICGKPGEYEMHTDRPILCKSVYGENSCWRELEWRYVLYVMGKDYYPQPEKEETK